MPKVILEFDSFEDSEELKVALEGGKWKGVAWDLDQYLRNKIKYNEDSLSVEVLDALEKVREELRELINSSQLYLE
jgi:hypothetical protein